MQPVISDAHREPRAAMATVPAGTAWQRCRVHCMRNVLAHVSKKDKSIMAAAIRTIFAQPCQEAARHQLAELVRAMEARWLKAADVLVAPEDDVLTYTTFPLT